MLSCKKSNNTPPCSITDAETGPLFKKVDSLVTVSCAGSNCHVGGGSQSGYSFDTKCQIVDNWNGTHKKTYSLSSSSSSFLSDVSQLPAV